MIQRQFRNHLSKVKTTAVANANGNAVASADPAAMYNLTFVARGLTDLFNGSNSWYIFVFNSTGAFPLYPTSNTVSKMVPGGTYQYQANDYFQDLYGDVSSALVLQPVIGILATDRIIYYG